MPPPNAPADYPPFLERLIEAAMAAVPRALLTTRDPPFNPAPIPTTGQKLALRSDLVETLGKCGHPPVVAEPAIDRLVAEGMLVARDFKRDLSIAAGGDRPIMQAPLPGQCEGLQSPPGPGKPGMTIWRRVKREPAVESTNRLWECAGPPGVGQRQSTDAPPPGPVPNDPPPEANGPHPPDRFRWGAATAGRLSGLQYRLLEALWGDGRPREAVPLGELVRELYPGRREGKDPRLALLALRRRVQERLDQANVRLEIDRANDTLRLRPTSGG
jgi:hypothetical protein